MSKKYKTGEQLIEEGYLPIDLLNNTFSGLWPAYDISSTSTEPITPNPVLSKITALIQALKNERDMKLRVDAERRGKLLELTKRKRDKKSSNEIFALEETLKGSACYLRTEDYERAINLMEGIVNDRSKCTWKNIQLFYSQGYNELLSFLDRRIREQALFDSILDELRERRYSDPRLIQQPDITDSRPDTQEPNKGKMITTWGSIATYLNCSTSNARKRYYESKGKMPIYKRDGSNQVFAWSEELNRWIEKNSHRKR